MGTTGMSLGVRPTFNRVQLWEDFVQREELCVAVDLKI